MGRLTVEQLNGQITFAERDVDLPELGGTVRVRALSKGKRDRVRKGIMNGETITDPAEFEIRLFCAGMVDPQVSRDQALRMKETWPGEMWDRVLVVIGELGGADPEEVALAAAEEFQSSDD